MVRCGGVRFVSVERKRETAVLIYLALNLVIAVTFALAATKLHVIERPATATGLWTLIGFQLLVAAPVMSYLMARHPEWYFLYFVEIERFDWPLLAWQLVPAAWAVAVYLGIRRLQLARPGLLNGVMLLLIAPPVAALLLLLGWPRIGIVGSTADLLDEGKLRPLVESTQGFLAAGALGALALAWLVTVWRLFLYARAVPQADKRYVGSVPVRDGNTKALPRPESAKKARAN